MNHPKYGQLREHQVDALRRAIDIATGKVRSRCTTAKVAPGCGKTLMASIFAHELISRGVIDQVLYVAPWDALRRQARDGFADNERNLDRFLVERGDRARQARQTRFGQHLGGQVVTYAELALHAKAIVKWMKRDGARTLVIPDECHHLSPNIASKESESESGDSSSWHETTVPVIEAATHSLFMSGTMARGNPVERVSFVDYDHHGLPRVDIKYGRSRGIKDGALICAEFMRVDGTVNYSDAAGEHQAQISATSSKMHAKMMHAALDPEGMYTPDLLIKAFEEWHEHRSRCNAKSKIIVLASTQPQARALCELLRAKWPHMELCLAIHSEGGKAKKAIARFRHDPDHRVLVTVAQAYEGLDVRSVTHIVCLSRVRSQPWLEQAFARATRFDPDCGLSREEQIARIYVPNDKPMITAIGDILREQEIALAERGATLGPALRRVKSSFESLGSEIGRTEYTDERGHKTAEESAAVEAMLAKVSWTRDIKRLQDRIDAARMLGFLRAHGQAS